MGKVPIDYRKSPEAVPTYSFTDLVRQAGIIQFYGARDEDSYLLTTNQFYSNRVMTGTSAVSGPGDTIQNDRDFDILFNIAQDIRGELIATIPWLFRNNAGTTQNCNVYMRIYVRKVDVANNEIDIADDTGETFAFSLTANTTKTGIHTISVTVPETHFAAGEKLRITVEHHSWNGGATAFHYLGHDPQNRPTDAWANEVSSNLTFTNDPTIMSFQVPFRLEL